MSRIGKKPIVIPKGVEVKVTDGIATVKGPKGELKKKLPELKEGDILVDGEKVMIRSVQDDKIAWGLCRAILNNLIIGVSKGFEKVLEFSGVGFKAQVKGQEIEMNLGFSHPVKIMAPAGVSMAVEKNLIKISGIDKELVGQTAARIRAIKPSEPYKGTGIKYSDEIVIRKAGKKAVAGA